MILLTESAKKKAEVNHIFWRIYIHMTMMYNNYIGHQSVLILCFVQIIFIPLMLHVMYCFVCFIDHRVGTMSVKKSILKKQKQILFVPKSFETLSGSSWLLFKKWTRFITAAPFCFLYALFWAQTNADLSLSEELSLQMALYDQTTHLHMPIRIKIPSSHTC